MVCQWTSEEQHVVLEVPDGEDSKSTSDSERTSWAQLLQEMEENKVSDPTINQHDLHAPVTDDSATPSLRICFWVIILGNKMVWRSGNEVPFLSSDSRSTPLFDQAESRAHLLPVCRGDYQLQVHQLCFCFHYWSHLDFNVKWKLLGFQWQVNSQTKGKLPCSGAAQAIGGTGSHITRAQGAWCKPSFDEGLEGILPQGEQCALPYSFVWFILFYFHLLSPLPSLHCPLPNLSAPLRRFHRATRHKHWNGAIWIKINSYALHMSLLNS